MNIKLNRSQSKFLFLLLITAIYTILIIQFDFLQGVKVKDEAHFWETSLRFSDSLIPSIDALRDYRDLNTPLPFIMFGAVEHIFDLGVFGGRLLNVILSIAMVFIIGWPSRKKGRTAILCLIGLFVCPYYLLSSAGLTTDIIAGFWVLLGFVAYVHNRHLLSCIGFILAIASRQYMLAFPIAITLYEFIINALPVIKNNREIKFYEQWRWIAPLIAASSILFWFYLFQGLAPSTGIEELAPTIQKTTWFLKPNRAIYFLAFTSIFIVIPEFILFRSKIDFSNLQWRNIALLALGWLLYCIIFPPPTTSDGMFSIIINLLHYEIIKIALFYFLSLLALLRFSQPNLMLLCLLFNCLIMMKAHYWSKYVLPLAIVFWYLKSLKLEQKFSFANFVPNFSIQK